jgi:hypothetical protein
MSSTPKTDKTPRFSARQYTNAGIATVFAIAVFISGQHIVHVATYFGQAFMAAIMLPAILDIFGLFCAIKLRLPSISGIARILARTGMWFSLGTSLWFNVESALITSATQGLHGVDLAKALFISSIPALVVMLSAEILTHVRKTPAKSGTRTPAKTPETAAKPPAAAKVPAPRKRTPKPAQPLSEPSAA